jgi:hypothetical protein
MRRHAILVAMLLIGCTEDGDSVSEESPSNDGGRPDATVDAGRSAISDGAAAPVTDAAVVGRDASDALDASIGEGGTAEAGSGRDASSRRDAALEDGGAGTFDAAVFDAAARTLDAGQHSDATVISDADVPTGPTQPAYVTIDAGPRKFVFATSISYTAALGGHAGADQVCTDHAVAGDLPGEYRAWLSTVEEPAAEHLVHSADPYVRTDDVLVAYDWDDLVDGELEAPIDRDEQGEMISGDVWTATLPDGAAYETDCAGFTSASNEELSLCGNSAARSEAWTDNLLITCSTALRLYCLEQ